MSVFNFSTKEKTKENYNELLYESSVLNFNCAEECICLKFYKVDCIAKSSNGYLQFCNDSNFQITKIGIQR